jgi:hypothetical protein
MFKLAKYYIDCIKSEKGALIASSIGVFIEPYITIFSYQDTIQECVNKYIENDLDQYTNIISSPYEPESTFDLDVI